MLFPKYIAVVLPSHNLKGLSFALSKLRFLNSIKKQNPDNTAQMLRIFIDYSVIYYLAISFLYFYNDYGLDIQKEPLASENQGRSVPTINEPHEKLQLSLLCVTSKH